MPENRQGVEQTEADVFAGQGDTQGMNDLSHLQHILSGEILDSLLQRRGVARP